MRQHRLNSRGFVGPIGDDLPSLIPITFSLLIFFASLSFTFNQFDYKRTVFDQDLTKLKISSTLKGNSLISDYATWGNSCQMLGSSSFKFRAGLYLVDTAENQSKTIPVFESTETDPNDPAIARPVTTEVSVNGFPETKTYQCENTDEKLLFSNLAFQRPVHVYYPVAVNLDNQIKPALLLVSVWR